MAIPFMMNVDGSVNLVVNSRMYQVRKEDNYYNEIVKSLPTATDEEMLALLDKVSQYKNYLSSADAGDGPNENGFEIGDGYIRFNGQNIHHVVLDRINMFKKNNLPVQPLVNFLKNLYQNPSSSSIAELYDFLEHGGFPITEDGCFIGYKGVSSNYMDKYTNTVSHAIGQKPSMPRNMVNDNREIGCSTGFHVGTFKYAKDYAGADGQFVLVKVNPKDVVSVPKDHSCEKLRVCAYEVIGHASRESKIEEPMFSMLDQYDLDIEKTDCVSFRYENEQRYLELIDQDYDHIYGYLIKPEEKAGEYRCFLKNKISEMQYFNCHEDEDEDEDDYLNF